MKLRDTEKSNLLLVSIALVGIALAVVFYKSLPKLPSSIPSSVELLRMRISSYHKENGDYPKYSELVPAFAEDFRKNSIVISETDENTLLLDGPEIDVGVNYRYRSKNKFPRIESKEIATK